MWFAKKFLFLMFLFPTLLFAADINLTNTTSMNWTDDGTNLSGVVNATLITNWNNKGSSNETTTITNTSTINKTVTGTDFNLSVNSTLVTLWGNKGTSNFTNDGAILINIAGANLTANSATGAGIDESTLQGLPAPNLTGVVPIASIGSISTATNVPAPNLTGTVPVANIISIAGAINVPGANLTANSATGAGIDENTLAIQNKTKGIAIYNITVNHDVFMWQTPKALTINKVGMAVVGAGNVSWMLEECDASATGCAGLNATSWVTEAGATQNITVFTDASIAANGWLKGNVTACNGTPTSFSASITYGE
jgi:hypothetical protein